MAKGSRGHGGRHCNDKRRYHCRAGFIIAYTMYRSHTATRGRALVTGLALALLAGAAPCWAQDWIVTVLEGDAVVIDGARRLAAAPGLKLGTGAIVETSAKTSLLRLEGSDKTTFDLGASTRVMVAPPGFAARADRTPQLYLLQGWVKATARGPLEAAGLISPALELLPFKGAVVLQLSKREYFAFVESGRAELLERRTSGGAVVVSAGEFYAGEATRRGSVTPRPAPGWLQTVPRPFRDPIPLRGAQLRDRRVEPPLLPGPTYAQLADWLTAEVALRRDFPARLATLVHDPEFRTQVHQHLNQHPEWGPLLAAEAAENARARRNRQ